MPFLWNLANLPLLVLTWLTETYLLFTAARLIMALVPSARQSQLYHQLRLLVDPLPNAVGQWLRRRGPTAPPLWLSWLIVILLAAILRQVIISAMA